MSSVRFGRRFANMVAVLAILAAAGPAHASADVPVTFDGGTAEEQRVVADVLSWPELPPLRQPITVTILDRPVLPTGGYSYGGCSGITLGTMAAAEPFAILHELGHVFDCQVMGGEYRHFIMACTLNDCRDGAYSWGGGDYLTRPEEMWAQSFAAEVESRHFDRPIRDNVWGPLPSKLVSRVINALTPCDSAAHPHGRCL